MKKLLDFLAYFILAMIIAAMVAVFGYLCYLDWKATLFAASALIVVIGLSALGTWAADRIDSKN